MSPAPDSEEEPEWPGIFLGSSAARSRIAVPEPDWDRLCGLMTAYLSGEPVDIVPFESGDWMQLEDPGWTLIVLPLSVEQMTGLGRGYRRGILVSRIVRRGAG